MNYTKTIAKNILRGQKKRYSQLIIKISITSIAIGVAVMLLSMSIVSGFQKTIRNKITGFGAHITISHFDLNQSDEQTPILADQFYLPELRKTKNIKSVQPFATKAGIIKRKEIVDGVVIKGVDTNYNFDFIAESLIQGKILDFKPTSSKSIIISKITADKLEIKLGDTVSMYFIQEPPRMRTFVVCGIYETGMAMYDNKFAITNIEQIRKLNNWDNNEVHGFEVVLKDFSKISETTEEVSRLIPYDQKAKNIVESTPEMFDWIDLFDTNMYILIGLMVIISTITVISTLLILILEQTNTIGILKAIGAKNSSISKIFTQVAGTIILKGILIGNTIALFLSIVQQQTHLFKLRQDLYYMDSVPIDLNLTHYLIINLGVFAVTTLFVFIPIMIVTRKVSTIQAIRYQ